MREIHIDIIKDKVAQMCIDACINVACDIRAFMEAAQPLQSSSSGLVLEKMLKNQDIARNERLPICQDTGMVVAFVRIGQDVRIIGGGLADAINAGVKKGYDDGYLRKSVVGDPLTRINTGDNTPAIIHYDIVPGDELTITISPKGFGSENMSRLRMLVPADGILGIKNFVLETVQLAHSNACPPIIVGVGIGGDFELSAIMAKKALLRTLNEPNPDPAWAKIEQEILKSVNKLNIGPAGLGGSLTAMAVHINTYATHIAGLPVAVNLGCHVNRHEEASL